MSDQDHLIELGKIISKFIKKYKFTISYLSIRGTIITNVHTTVDIDCMSEFDRFTVAKVFGIRRELYNSLRLYLLANNITKPLILRDAPTHYWAKNGVELVFEETLTIN